MAPSLPCELTEEILCKTPLESLLRFRATCKEWYAIIHDKHFAYDLSPRRILRLENRDRAQIMDPVTGRVLSDSPIPHEFGGRSNPITSLLHCDGLMLCMCYGQSDGANLALWNPIFKNVSWINPSVRYWDTDYFGIGYDKSSRDSYKILRVRGPLSRDAGKDPKCEIYSCSSSSWKALDYNFDGRLDIDCRGVSVKGNMYWVCEKDNADDDIVLCFDFSRETFKYLCVCPPSWHTRKLACFDRERLSLLEQNSDAETSKIRVSVTNNLSDEVVSFSVYFEVTSPYLLRLRFDGYTARPGYSVGQHRDVIIWCEENLVEDDVSYACIKFYEIDEGGIRKETVTRRGVYMNHNDPFICSSDYVTSLLPVPI